MYDKRRRSGYVGVSHAQHKNLGVPLNVILEHKRMSFSIGDKVARGVCAGHSVV